MITPKTIIKKTEDDVSIKETFKIQKETDASLLVFSTLEKKPCYWNIKEVNGELVFTNSMTNRRLTSISIDAFNKALVA
jgi:hypothetical protein